MFFSLLQCSFFVDLFYFLINLLLQFHALALLYVSELNYLIKHQLIFFYYILNCPFNLSLLTFFLHFPL
jgi:hypothetical protein